MFKLSEPFHVPGANDQGYCFCAVCLSVCQFVVNFNIHYNFLTVRDRDFIFVMHNNALSNDTRVNDLVILTLTFVLKMAILDFVVHLHLHS